MSGIVAGEQPPDETILWMPHAGITTRNVADTSLVLDVLADRKDQTTKSSFFRSLSQPRELRLGIVNNSEADNRVFGVFQNAIEIIRTFGHHMEYVAAPFVNIERGVAKISADRASIAARAFNEIDVLLLPTMPSSIPSVEESANNPQALSAENTLLSRC